MDQYQKDKKISIHAPREGSDEVIEDMIGCAVISIHAPREGSDYIQQSAAKESGYFNPRSP